MYLGRISQIPHPVTHTLAHLMDLHRFHLVARRAPEALCDGSGDRFRPVLAPTNTLGAPASSRLPPVGCAHGPAGSRRSQREVLERLHVRLRHREEGGRGTTPAGVTHNSPGSSDAPRCRPTATNGASRRATPGGPRATISPKPVVVSGSRVGWGEGLGKGARATACPRPVIGNPGVATGRESIPDYVQHLSPIRRSRPGIPARRPANST